MDINFKMENDMTDLIKEAAFSQIERALVKIGLQAEANAKQEITKSVYSKPESPYYKRTGRLRNSITNTHDKNTVYIGTNVEYAPYVEFGTKRVSARPYLKPAIVNHLEEYKSIVEDELK